MPNEVIQWVAPNGAQYTLDETQGAKVLLGRDGWYMPNLTFIEAPVPQQAGTHLKDIMVNPRELDLPLLIRGASPADLLARKRWLMDIFNPLKGGGTLLISNVDGGKRQIVCRYSSGLELSDNSQVAGAKWQKLVLVLRAFDPFWTDAENKVFTFKTGTASAFFPFFPLKLTSSAVMGTDVLVENFGDVEAFPQWVVTGPGTSISLLNVDTGETVTLNITLIDGDVLTVNTAPGKKGILKNGVNAFDTLTDDSVLWTLRPGVNKVRLSMAGATAASSVQLMYKARYWGA